MISNRFAQAVTLSPADNFNPITEDDLQDIRSLFRHTPRSFAADKRDLQRAPNRKTDAPLTFCLRSVLSGNIS